MSICYVSIYWFDNVYKINNLKVNVGIWIYSNCVIVKKKFLFVLKDIKK